VHEQVFTASTSAFRYICVDAAPLLAQPPLVDNVFRLYNSTITMQPSMQDEIIQGVCAVIHSFPEQMVAEAVRRLLDPVCQEIAVRARASPLRRLASCSLPVRASQNSLRQLSQQSIAPQRALAADLHRGLTRLSFAFRALRDSRRPLSPQMNAVGSLRSPAPRLAQPHSAQRAGPCAAG
jgi:hypothetical protein